MNEGASPSEIVLKLMQRVKKNELSHQAVDYDIDM